MGAVASALVGAGKSLKIAAGILHGLYKQFNTLDARINEAPGLPRPSPTKPFWLENPPYPELVNVQSPLPPYADVVIIGSGITGAAVARSLLEPRPSSSSESHKRSIVVLEARELCSGATGRNGGHIKSSPHEAIDHFIKAGMPGERAAALVRFQLSHLNHLVALCESDEALKKLAECREVETVDIFVDKVPFEKCQNMVTLLKQWVPEFEMKVWQAAEAQKAVREEDAVARFLLTNPLLQKFSAGPHVVGAISYAAGALWPYRFVATIWKSLLNAHAGCLSIATNTPVESIGVDNSKEHTNHPHLVVTPRGIIRARHVVHATNAFASHLLPQLRRKMTGIRAHMSAQQPGPRFPDLGGQRSWSIIYGSGYDYVTQRPSRAVETDSETGAVLRSEPGEIMTGGGFVRSAGEGLDQLGLYDDTTTDFFTAVHLHGVLPSVFAPFWGPDTGASHGKPVGEGHVKSLWSGVIGMAADFIPFVGRLDPRTTGRPLPSKKPEAENGDPVDAGEWISASYQGDGMVYAWLSGTALGLMIAGRDQEILQPAPGRPAGRVVDWLPKEMWPSYDRLSKIDVTDLAGLIL